MLAALVVNQSQNLEQINGNSMEFQDPKMEVVPYFWPYFVGYIP